ncbi:MAG: hypothetical protein VX335_03630 [Pseudomonadota bacterium]|nr:hypothetical protein [Pseudomonadota bacterium]
MPRIIKDKLSTIINSVIAADDVLREDLASFNNKIIAIELTGINLNIYFKFVPQGLLIIDELSDDTDITKVTGSAFSFLEAVRNLSDAKESTSGIHITGDIGVVSKLLSILRKTEIDWSQYLSTKIGDVPAEMVINLLKSTKKVCDNITDNTRENIKDFLLDEISLIPAKLSFEEFSDEVAILRDDVARASQRVERLKNKKES